MALKRTYQVGSPQDLASRNVKQRVARVERLIKNVGELKHITNIYNTQVNNAAIGFIELTSMAAGSTVANRVGNEVEIVKVEIRGCLGTTTFPFYSSYHLVTSMDATVPVISDFSSQTGGHYALAKGTELRHQFAGPNASNSFIRMNWKPKYKWITRYKATGTGDTIRNPIYFVLNNATGGQNLSPQISWRIWYRDV